MSTLQSIAEDGSRMEVENQTQSSIFDPNDLPELLRIYYDRFFPYGLFYRWFNYGEMDTRFFSLREFCFTLKDDIYVRYQSFENQKDLEKGIQAKRPYKIDIGAVYSQRIVNAVANASAVPIQRELIFDIDMTDYDDVRICCSEANICNKCWPLMTLAIKIIHRILTEDFGFQHILWIYSGRRGVHCWVCDHKARVMPANARSAIVEYISLIQKGNVGKARTVHLSSFTANHHNIAKALSLVREHFHRHLIQDQHLMENEKGEAKVLAMVEDPAVVTKYRTVVEHLPGSENRWKKLCDIIETRRAELTEKGEKGPTYWNLLHVVQEIQVQFCYPRLDENVSRGMNHLLKSPFSVHPKTGRVCVPMNPLAPEDFDPFRVPTVSELVDQVNAYNAMHTQDENQVPDWKKTTLRDGITLLEKFVRKMEVSRRKVKHSAEDSKMEF